MTDDSDAGARRCSQCGKWSSPVFDIKTDIERVVFADSTIIPDPHVVVSQHISQSSKSGLCRNCMMKELALLQEMPDRAIIAVDWPSNGGPNA